MKKRKIFQRIAIAGITAAVVCGIVLGVAIWQYSGGFLAAAPCTIGSPPSDLDVCNIEFESDSGRKLHGWFVRGEANKGGILLIHGFKRNRTQVIDHASFLNKAGYSVLLFDLQAHGESEGDLITFGYLESLDARSALAYLKNLIAPSEPVGAIGISLGGAACVLGPDVLKVDALVLEEMFATIDEAVGNRIKTWFPVNAGWLTPVMLWQVHPRLGVSTEKLRPIDFMPRLSVPLLVIAGTGDPFTPLAESKRLFSAASGPKELWEAEGATHESICSYAPDTYKLVVLRFFDKYLPSGETPSFSVKKQEEIKTRASLASPGGKSYGEGRAQNTYLTNRKSFAKNIQ